MNEIVRPLEVVAADFQGFQRVLEKVFTTELESFQGLSGQYALFEDVDALMGRMRNVVAQAERELVALRDGAFEDSALWSASRRVELVDSMLEQLDRFVQVADARGATLTSGDLLKKLQGWIKIMREWLTGVRRQLAAIAGEE
ncbi:hypothetical protein L6Q21_10480 [Sandaracinobacter sp. RS1-74]|uniref:hypothetical protein n=1 Tax=Sandaracinobacteroides sayramensis TaxID=2913411 RepID=UPI001EDB44AA|nr:hypothetical protein [Sandaracinobacteroides sayramensis]MCG2841407.1 hypothetical protein [Sandaracinobacteroides sayramensis]